MLLVGAGMSRRYLGGFVHQQEHDPWDVLGYTEMHPSTQAFPAPRCNCKITHSSSVLECLS